MCEARPIISTEGWIRKPKSTGVTGQGTEPVPPPPGALSVGPNAGGDAAPSCLRSKGGWGVRWPRADQNSERRGALHRGHTQQALGATHRPGCARGAQGCQLTRSPTNRGPILPLQQEGPRPRGGRWAPRRPQSIREPGALWKGPPARVPTPVPAGASGAAGLHQT